MKLLRSMYCRVFQGCFRLALPLLPYREPKPLSAMEDVIPVLREHRITAVLLVADQGVRRLGLTAGLEAGLQQASISCTVYEQETPNPTIHQVEAARQRYIDGGCQAIIVVGGGSAMDCAKAVGARIARPRKSLQKMRGLLQVLKPTPLLIAVPTTAGTGSETTLAAVITDSETHHKYPINDFALIPSCTVLDPQLTLGLPPMVTATTGMDALTHAVEAYIGHTTNKLTRAMSEEAVTLIVRYLRRAVEDGSDLEARQGMLRAAYCAGVAFTRSYVGYVHALAHALGGQYGIAHGLANAVILPMMLECYGDSCHAALARLARVAGLAEGSVDDSAAAGMLLDWIQESNRIFGLPRTFPEIRRADIPTLAARADQEANPLYPVPVLMDRFELEQVLLLLGEFPAPEKDAETLVARQRAYFQTGATLPYRVRRDALTRLQRTILEREGEINAALQQDLGKSPSESYMCEVGMTLSELSHMRRHLRWYMAKHRAWTPLAQFPSDSFTVRNPYGVTLVMSPWNYPFLLTMEPVIGAVAAGNCCVVKPSAYSPATSAIMREILSECFPPEQVAVVEGGRAENQALLDQTFDKIFFTGGVKVGQEVLRKAAEHLTPVTLELGGKSPVVVDATANLDVAAKRIAFGKLLNCGQTCVAPDYILVDRKVKDDLIRALIHCLDQMNGDGLDNDSYVHMITRKHFDRVCGLIDMDKVIYGGKSDPETLRIQPTLMDNVTGDDPVMQEEIFGPLLPILTFDSVDEAVQFIGARPHPLACYLFSKDKAVQRRFLNEVPFGGGCINDTIIHLATSRMGFGGVGGSGMGQYHGRRSFDCFSHEKSIVHKATWLDLPYRYAPYAKWKDKLIRMFLR